MHCFAPIADSLVAEQATVAIRLFATRTHDNPDAKAAGDEALQEDYHDGRCQEPVPAPRRRVRSDQPIIDSGLVEARRLARREVVQRRRIRRRFDRFHAFR